MKKIGSRCVSRIRKFLSLAVTVFMMAAMCAFPALADGVISLTTSYPGITAKPGESLNIPVTLSNHSGVGETADVAITSIPDGWDAYLQGDSYQVTKVYAADGADADLTLHVAVPKELEEGTYPITVKAQTASGASSELNLSFLVAEKNAGAGTFTCENAKQQGTSGTNFSFTASLSNNSLRTKSYSLSANAPDGWTVGFTPAGTSAKSASMDVDSSTGKNVTVSVTPAQDAPAGDYTITCNASSADESLSTDVTVSITGSYGMKISTPNELLSFDAHAGKTTDVTLDIANTGNIDLNNVTLNSTVPTGWTVTYDSGDNVIGSIPAGSTKEVIAHVKANDKAITGDYAAEFTASCADTNATAAFRVSVKTGTLWGFVALFIILAVAGGLGSVFKKYGRR